MFKNSLYELKNVNNLVKCSLFIALYVALRFLRAQVSVSTALWNVDFLAIAISGAMFGPVAGVIVGLCGDLLSALFMPLAGGFNIGFTLNNILSGLLYGCLLYKNISVIRLVFAKLIENIFISLILTNVWLYVVGATAFFELLLSRAPVKLFISLPVEAVLLVIFLLTLKKIFPDYLKCPKTKN